MSKASIPAEAKPKLNRDERCKIEARNLSYTEIQENAKLRKRIREALPLEKVNLRKLQLLFRMVNKFHPTAKTRRRSHDTRSNALTLKILRDCVPSKVLDDVLLHYDEYEIRLKNSTAASTPSPPDFRQSAVANDQDQANAGDKADSGNTGTAMGSESWERWDPTDIFAGNPPSLRPDWRFGTST
jgi:hypothetical protein